MVAGIDPIDIMQAGGWRTYHVLARYVENAAAGRMHERRWQRLGQLAAAYLFRYAQAADRDDCACRSA